jgi:hypothetical protein
MDGCDGHDGVGCGGLDGFDGPGFDGIDTIDLLNGAEHASAPGDAQGAESVFNGVGVSADGDTIAVRVSNHRLVSLFDVFRDAAESVGLLKVASILVGQKGFEPKKSYSILHNLSAIGAKTGSMPNGYNECETGSTTMFRQYFQIPRRDWGWLSTPTYDKDASVYLDISGMTWNFETAACESQLLVRVVPLQSLCQGVWGIKPDRVDAHRKAARKVGDSVHGVLNRYAQPSRAAVAARTPAPRAVAPARQAEPFRMPSLGGADLLSALRRSPQFGAMHTLTAGLQSPLSESQVATPEGVEMVTLRMAMPRRATA